MIDVVKESSVTTKATEAGIAEVIVEAVAEGVAEAVGVPVVNGDSV
jgi:hypothetical protein